MHRRKVAKVIHTSHIIGFKKTRVNEPNEQRHARGRGARSNLPTRQQINEQAISICVIKSAVDNMRHSALLVQWRFL